MTEVRSLGIGSGVLSADLVDQLIAAEREASDIRLDQKQAVVEAKISALADIGSLVAELESAARSVSGVSSLNAKVASSSNESAITATASSLSSQGSWMVDVNALAQSQSIASQSYDSGDATIGTGTLRFNFGSLDYTANTTFDFTADPEQSGYEISIDASNNSLSGIANTINQANIGINASVIDTGDGVRLVMASTETGEQKAFTLSVTSSDDDLNALAFNETRFNDEGLNTELLQTASSAELTVNGLAVKRDSNLIIDVIDGLTLNLKETTTSAVNLTVETDVSTISERIQSFVESYNGLREGLNVVTDYDSDTNQGSVFSGDSTMRLLEDRLRQLLNQSLGLLTNGSFSSLTEIGIQINDWESGLLSFNQSTFESMLSLYPDDIDALFGSDGRTSSDDITFLSAPSTVTPGSYEVVITQAATSAVYEGRSTGTSTFTISDTNDEITVNVDGRSSGALRLTQGTYTGAELASELANRINASTLITSSVSVQFDDTNQNFIFTSGSKGILSSIEIASADAGMANSLGLVPKDLGGFVTDNVTDLAIDDALDTAIVIDDSNDEIGITVGDTATTVTLGQGTYNTLSEVAAAVQSAFSGNTDLVGAGVSTTVSGSASTTASTLSFELSQLGSPTSWQVNSLEGDIGTLLGLSGGGYNGEASEALSVTSTLLTSLTGSLDFVLSVDGTDSDPLSIAVAGTDADQIALDIQTAINADANLLAATTEAVAQSTFTFGASAHDFTTEPREFTLKYGGTDYQIVINSDAVVDTGTPEVDDVAEIQAAVDAALGGGILTVGDNGGAIAISTVATGSSATFELVADGGTVTTANGATGAFASGADFSGANADSITINYADTSIEVLLGESAVDYVSGGGLAASGFTNDADVQAYIQQQLDYALEQAGLDAGDIQLNLDGSNLNFESKSVRGISNSFSHGVNAEISIVGKIDTFNVLAAEADYTGGTVGLGYATGSYRGTDASGVTVTFEGDDQGGRFIVEGNGYQAYSISALSAFGSAQLGFSEGAQSTATHLGTNVAGTIGGEQASGSGSILTGLTGNVEGLRISSSAETAGVAGRVTWITGIAKQIADFIDGFTAVGSGLNVKTQRLDSQLAEINEEREELDIRMAAREALMVAQFTYADSLVATINTTSDFLSRQLNILEAIVTPRKDS